MAEEAGTKGKAVEYGLEELTKPIPMVDNLDLSVRRAPFLSVKGWEEPRKGVRREICFGLSAHTGSGILRSRTCWRSHL